MAQIVEFKRKKEVITEAQRWKAIAKGRIRYFTCDDCGSDIEVIDEQYPYRCPGCGRIITGWNKSEEKT